MSVSRATEPEWTTSDYTEFEVEALSKSKRIIRDLAERTKAQYYPIGYLRLLLDPQYKDVYKKSIPIQRSYGVEDSIYLESDQVSDIIPDVNTADVHGALYGPSDGYTDPETLTQVYAKLAQENGVTIRTGVEVTDVKTKHGRVDAVETTDGTVDCDVVVNAAGGWAPVLADMVDLDLPAAPYRRQVVIGKPDTDLDYTMPAVMAYTPETKDQGVYFRDDKSGKLFLSLHKDVGEEEAPIDDLDHFDYDHDMAFVLDLTDAIEQRIPEIADFSIINGYACFYTITPDSQPIVDAHPDLEGYYVTTGMSGKGIELSPIMGALTADLVIDGEPKAMANISPFRLARFEGR